MKRKVVHNIIITGVIAGSLMLYGFNVQASGIFLKLGQQNEQVKELQTKLKSLGYFNSEATGYYGQITEYAVKAYQKANGFTVDGVVGDGTWGALLGTTQNSGSQASNNETLLKLGMQNDQVKQLQQKLKALGYLNTEATGYFGQLTENAVKAYQKAKGFNADGVVGSGTWNSLFSNDFAATIDESLKQGDNNEKVKQLQERLKELGYFKENTTGYFGNITTTSVISYQKSNGLTADGVVGKTTWNKLFGTINVAQDTIRVATSRGETRESGLIPWETVKDIFSIGTVATVIDIKTGIQYQVKRTYGESHADVEPLTADDTAKLKQTYGGQWSWDRRPVVVIINDRKFAASTNGMPHAGLDSQPANAVVSNRSGGYGKGENLDAVKGNNMDGQVCIHFLGSKTHGGDKVDPAHQAAVKEAAKWIEEH